MPSRGGESMIGSGIERPNIGAQTIDYNFYDLTFANGIPCRVSLGCVLRGCRTVLRCIRLVVGACNSSNAWLGGLNRELQGRLRLLDQRDSNGRRTSDKIAEIEE